MSINEKLEDFNYLFNTINKSSPIAKDMGEIYNYNFYEKKNLYMDLIKKTDDDFSYICTIYGIMNDIPSCHSNLVFPNYDVYDFSAHNSEKLIHNLSLHPYSDYWNKVLKEGCKLNTNAKGIVFNYVEGKYIINNYASKITDKKNNEEFFLKSVDGLSIDKYIEENLFFNKIRYDIKRNKSYRKNIVFFENYINKGKEINLEFINEFGDKINKKMYYSIENEVVFNISSMYNENTQDTLKSYIFNDKTNKITYINLVTFDDFANIIDLFKNMNNKNLIIDLRYNGGGYIKLVEKILPYFIVDELNTTREYYILKNNYTKILKKYAFTWKDAGFMKIKNYSFNNNGKKYLKTNFKQKFIPNDDIYKPKNIYILTSKETASTADNFVSILKDNNLAKIIGENTFGEGYGDTYFIDNLPNSNLVFTFMASKAYNKDGTNNNLYGTLPDIYSEINLKAFKIKENLLINEEDIFTYENRLKWDNTLLTAIEEIKEKNY